MTSVVRPLAVISMLAWLVGCSAAEAPAAQPTSGELALGLALDAHPCVAGSNIVRAAVFIDDHGNVVRYATPADGQLRVELLQKNGARSPAEVRWLDTPKEMQDVSL